jgi:hypothetical protein
LQQYTDAESFRRKRLSAEFFFKNELRPVASYVNAETPEDSIVIGMGECLLPDLNRSIHSGMKARQACIFL